MLKCAALKAQNQVQHSRALSELQRWEPHVPAGPLKLISRLHSNVIVDVHPDTAAQPEPILLCVGPRKPRR